MSEAHAAGARVAGNVAMLAAARAFSMLLAFVQMGILLRALGVEGMADYSFALNYAALFTVFATLGIQRLLTRDIAREPALAWRHAWTAFGVMLAASVAMLGLSYGISLALGLSEPERWSVLAAGAWVIVLWALQTPFEAILTARERLGLLAAVYVVQAVLKLAAIFFVMQRVPESYAAHGAIAGANLAAFALCAVLTMTIAQVERPRFEPLLAWRHIRESLPFIAAMLCSLIYFKSDMTLLKLLGTDAAAGQYGAVQRVLEPLAMLAGLWGMAVFPALARLSVHAPGDFAALKRTTLRLSLAVGMPLGAVVAVLSAPILQVLAGNRYGEFAAVVPAMQVLTAIIPLFFINGIGQEFFFAANRDWFVVRTYAAAAAVSAGLNAALIPAYGLWSVTAAALASNGIIALVFAWGLQQELGRMRLLPLLAKTLLACGGFALVLWLMPSVPLIVAAALGGVLYIAAQYALRTLNAEERAIISDLLKRMLPGAGRPRHQ